MASVEVTSVVASILAAFESGMDIFRRMRMKRGFKKSRKKPERLTEEEWQIQTSLQHRPREIKAEHDRNIARLGSRFSIGDCTAQTSLNHTLLILNAGLIRILSHTLSDDTKAQAVSRRSLLELSETAAVEAVRALEELKTRLSSSSQLTLAASPSTNTKAPKPAGTRSKGATSASRARAGPKPRSKSFSNTERKRPGPDPLVRGAWVRSKSGTSIISASSSFSGKTAPKASNHKSTSPPFIPDESTLPRPCQHHRTRSSPAQTPGPSRRGRAESYPDNSVSHVDQSPPSYYLTNQTYTQNHYPSRQPSLLLASPEVFTDLAPTRTMQPRHQTQPPTPPPKIPLSTDTPSRTTSPPNLPGSRMRPRPLSVATFLTASTKIGEIPAHKWPVDRDSDHDRGSARPFPSWEEQQQLLQRPLPYVIPPRLEGEHATKRRGRGFRFWKRSEQIAGC